MGGILLFIELQSKQLSKDLSFCCIGFHRLGPFGLVHEERRKAWLDHIRRFTQSFFSETAQNVGDIKICWARYTTDSRKEGMGDRLLMEDSPIRNAIA